MMIFIKFRQLFKRRIKGGQRIAVTLYRGTCLDDAETMRRYLQAHKDGDELLMVEDAKGNDVYVKIEDVVFHEETNYINETRYTVRLKGVITND